MKQAKLQSPFPNETARILDEARSRGIILRLLGGLAVKYHCPSAYRVPLQFNHQDFDFFGLGLQAQPIRKLFADLSFEPNLRFNVLQGNRRLMFTDIVSRRTVDVFLDVFRMCHKLPIGKRLMLDDYTIPITDLLLTKLQIVEMNEKDIRDIVAILHDHEVMSSLLQGEKERIDADYVARLCRDDWGLCRTITGSLRKILTFAPGYDLSPEARVTVETSVAQLLNFINEGPKSLKWRLRGLVGERVRWYDVPEEPARLAK